MVQHFKCVIFDVDGTILDTSEGIFESVEYKIKHFGFHDLTDKQLKEFIGPPIQNSFSSKYDLHGDILQEIATVFRDRYKTYDLLKAKPYDGIYILFSELKKQDITTAIATYKRQDYATELLVKFDFDKYTNIIFGADHENKLKKKDIIELALKKAGITDYHDAVMIGDSDNDAIGANELGINFIGVTYGFGFKTKEDVLKFNPYGVAANVDELITMLTRWKYENKTSKIYIWVSSK